MEHPDIAGMNVWPRNLSTSVGGGLSTALGGGMSTALGGGMSTALHGGLSTALGGGLSTALGGGLSTALGGGLSTALGGGMSTAASNVYTSNIPPWPVFVQELDRRGYRSEAALVRQNLPHQLWPENFFR